MRTSCISHPKNNPLVIIRAWQVAFCNGNRCAAALLSFFEHWHNYKIAIVEKNKKANDIAEAHGESRHQDEGLYQFHTFDELADGIIGLYGKTTVIEAIQLLVEKKAISVHNNPNPRYKFDKTKYYRFYPEICNQWLAEHMMRGSNESDASNVNETIAKGKSRNSEGAASTTCQPKKPEESVLVDHFRKTEIDHSILSDRSPENNQRSLKSERAITQITSQNNNEMNRREEIIEKDNNDFLDILYQLQAMGIPPPHMRRSDDQQTLKDLIDKVRLKQQLPKDIFATALYRAQRAKQGQPFGIYYLAPIVRQILEEGNRGASARSQDTIQHSSRPAWDEDKNYFSPGSQEWLNEEEQNNDIT